MKHFFRVLFCLTLTVSSSSQALSQFNPPKDSKINTLGYTELASITGSYVFNFAGLINSLFAVADSMKGSSVTLGQCLRGSLNALDVATHGLNFVGLSADIDSKVEDLTGLSTSNAYIRVLSNLMSMGLHVSNLLFVKRVGSWRALELVDAFEICGHANDIGYSIHASLKSDASEEECKQD